MKRKIFSRIIVGVFLLLVLAASICEKTQGDIASGMLRLHIVANSDDEADQKIKLEVRDAIIEASKEIISDDNDKNLTNDEKEKLVGVAENVLRSKGADYDAVLMSGNYYFPTRQYENITLPAGNYDAIKVVLGEGKGQNWWCVMYPPLCFTQSALGTADEESMKALREGMSENCYELISEENIKTVPAFKAVEIWQNLKEKVRNFL